MEQKQYFKMSDVFNGKCVVPVDTDDEIYIQMPLSGGYVFCGEFSYRNIAQYAAHAINSHDELVAEHELLLELLDAAKAVVARWDTPNWKDAEPTAAVIGRLRAVINKCGGSAS